MSQFADDSDSVVLQMANTSLYVDSACKGKGTLSIEEEYLRWTSNECQSDVVTLSYPSIAVHAISRDTSSFQYQCLYILSHSEEDNDGGSSPHDDDDDDEDTADSVTELRFVPANIQDLEEMYAAVCKCQLLYPDPELSDDSLEDYGDDDDGNEEGDEDVEQEENGEGVGHEWDGLVELDDTENNDIMYFTSAEEGLPHLTTEGQAVLEHLESVLVMPSPDEFATLVNEDQHENGGDQFEDVPDN